MTDKQLLVLWLAWDQRPGDPNRAGRYVDGLAVWAHERGTKGHTVHGQLAARRRAGLDHQQALAAVSAMFADG